MLPSIAPEIFRPFWTFLNGKPWQKVAKDYILMIIFRQNKLRDM